MVYFFDFVSLSVSLVLKLARADFKLSGSELVRTLEMTSFYEFTKD